MLGSTDAEYARNLNYGFITTHAHCAASSEARVSSYSSGM